MRRCRPFPRAGQLLAPRKRAVGSWMQFALGETRETERLQKIARSAADFAGHELADADHLIPVVRVGDDKDVAAEAVEYRKVVGRERADAAGRLFLEFRKRPLEALLTERERRAPHASEVLAHHEVRRLRAIGIDLHLRGVRLHLE